MRSAAPPEDRRRLLGLGVLGMLCSPAHAQTTTTMPTARTAQGTFTVKMQPLGEPRAESGVSLGRMSLDKVFEGDLVGTGQGEMLTALTPVQGSAGYVAIERVTGRLHGVVGSFVLQHSGSMDAGAQQLAIGIVPDSGTGALSGIRGALRLRIAGGQHHYTIDYSLP